MVVTTTGFSVLARLTGRSGGVADLRIAEYPGPLGIHDAGEISRNVEAVLIGRIVDALTRSDGTPPGTAPHAAADASHAVFAGTADEIEQHFSERGWTDGLPIIPPTNARIEAFLAHTHRGPDDELAILPAANLKATPRNVAANAVMAGCRPEHMPLIVAAVEALGDERCSLNNLGSSSGIIPYLLVNGPAVKRLGLACAAQLVSRGPNPAIGRAIGLVVKNIAGFRPGERYMGTFGYPLPFVLAEANDGGPWAPFHVQQGFERGESTVTVGVTNNWGPAPAPYDRPDKPGAQTALEMLCREIPKKTRLFNFPGRGPDAEEVMITLVLSPPVARSLADAGYSIEDVKQHVYENARMALGDFEWVLKYTGIQHTTLSERVAAGVLPAEFMGAPGDRVRVLSSPDILHVIVCGDPHRNRIMVMEGGHTRPTTRRIVFPPAV